MRIWCVAAGVIAIGTLMFAIQDFDTLTDPWANQVTIERGYHPNGTIRVETPCNRCGQIHGWQTLYDEDGRIITEMLFEHGEWLVNRHFVYERHELIVHEANFTERSRRVEAIPEPYYEYRCIERLHEPYDEH
jgi:hypothetical protein